MLINRNVLERVDLIAIGGGFIGARAPRPMSLTFMGGDKLNFKYSACPISRNALASGLRDVNRTLTRSG